MSGPLNHPSNYVGLFPWSKMKGTLTVQEGNTRSCDLVLQHYQSKTFWCQMSGNGLVVACKADRLWLSHVNSSGTMVIGNLVFLLNFLSILGQWCHKPGKAFWTFGPVTLDPDRPHSPVPRGPKCPSGESGVYHRDSQTAGPAGPAGHRHLRSGPARHIVLEHFFAWGEVLLVRYKNMQKNVWYTPL